MSVPAPPPGVATLRRPRRPPVLDASRTALIPLRPLTPTEILDGGFLIVRRNISMMLGLPLVLAGGAAAYVLAGVGLWFLLGNTAARGAQIALAVVMGLFGLLLLQQCLVWMTAILTRVSLQTVLGEGFAPAETKLSLRAALPLFWPVLGLSLLQYVAVGVVQTVLSVAYYAVIFSAVLTGIEDETVTVVLTVAMTALTYVVAAVAYGYLSLTVPSLAAESRNAPAWIGTPAKPTTVISAFERAFRLVGKKNLLRIALLYAGLMLICFGVIVLALAGTTGILALFADTVGADVETVLSNRWTIFGLISAAVLIAMSALLAYVAAVQTLVYLDLRMRREGLDLAMRFDCVPIPEPNPPPGFRLPVYLPSGDPRSAPSSQARWP